MFFTFGDEDLITVFDVCMEFEDDLVTVSIYVGWYCDVSACVVFVVEHSRLPFVAEYACFYLL